MRLAKTKHLLSRLEGNGSHVEGNLGRGVMPLSGLPLPDSDHSLTWA